MCFRKTVARHESVFLRRILLGNEVYWINTMLDVSALSERVRDEEPFMFDSLSDEIRLYKYYYKHEYCSWRCLNVLLDDKSTKNNVVEKLSCLDSVSSFRLIEPTKNGANISRYSLIGDAVRLVKIVNINLWKGHAPFTVPSRPEESPYIYAGGLNAFGLGLSGKRDFVIRGTLCLRSLDLEASFFNMMIENIKWINDFDFNEGVDCE